MKTTEETIIEHVGEFWWICGKHRSEFLKAMCEYAVAYAKEYHANALPSPQKPSDIAKTETDTGHLIDMPDLKPEEPQRKGAEEILINAEEIFIKHFSKFRTEPFKSSLDYFISTGHVSGSLFSEIYDYYNEFAQQAIEVSDERSIITSFAKYWNDKLGGEVITYSDISKYLKIKGTKT